MTPKKHALTLGIESAEGEIIILTDADCRVGKLWVSSMVYSVINQNCISIGFSEIGVSSNSLFEKYQYIDWDRMKWLNTNRSFLSFLSFYNLASPILNS